MPSFLVQLYFTGTIRVRVMKLGTCLHLVEASCIQILLSCIKFSSCFLEMVSFSGQPIFCDKTQAGETPHSAEFLFTP